MIKYVPLLLAIALVVFLDDIIGSTLGKTIMYGIAGWQIGGWAQTLGKQLEAKYGQGH